MGCLLLCVQYFAFAGTVSRHLLWLALSCVRRRPDPHMID